MDEGVTRCKLVCIHKHKKRSAVAWSREEVKKIKYGVRYLDGGDGHYCLYQTQ